GNDELPALETLTHDAVRAGAVIGSNSWSDDVQGRYNLAAAEFDALVRDADADTPGEQPYILEFSAGNAGPGPQTLDSPAVAKNVIATGASENDRFDFFIYADGDDAMADFSSRGPCEDGRIKPDVGWGRVALTNLIGSSRRLEYVDQTQLLSTGQSYEHRVIVASSTQPLKITLAYTDVPGLPAALPALVNDLDLEVVGPDGKVY